MKKICFLDQHILEPEIYAVGHVGQIIFKKILNVVVMENGISWEASINSYFLKQRSSVEAHPETHSSDVVIFCHSCNRVGFGFNIEIKGRIQ